MPNFLEQLVAEWYEYQKYFVRRNTKVDKRQRGGHDGELDIIAYSPSERKIVHVETSMEAGEWAKMDVKFCKKFAAGKKYIEEEFKDFVDFNDTEIEQFAVLGGTLSDKTHTYIGGCEIKHIRKLVNEIMDEIEKKKVEKEAVPEQFVILRTFQFAANFWKRVN